MPGVRGGDVGIWDGLMVKGLDRKYLMAGMAENSSPVDILLAKPYKRVWEIF